MRGKVRPQHPQQAFSRTRPGNRAPVPSRYTRSVAMHPIRRGAMPTDRVHHLPQQAQPRAIPPDTPQPFASDAATQLRHARPAPNERRCTRYIAKHPLRRDAPDQKGCNAYGSGTPPPTTSRTAGDSSPQTPTVRLGHCDTASTCSPGSEREALHQLGSVTSPLSWRNTT